VKHVIDLNVKVITFFVKAKFLFAKRDGKDAGLGKWNCSLFTGLSDFLWRGGDGETVDTSSV
jgi:hypothetical protein